MMVDCMPGALMSMDNLEMGRKQIYSCQLKSQEILDGNFERIGLAYFLFLAVVEASYRCIKFNGGIVSVGLLK